MGYWFDINQDIVRISNAIFQVTVWYGTGRGAPNQALTYIFPTDVPQDRLTDLLIALAIERHQATL